MAAASSLVDEWVYLCRGADLWIDELEETYAWKELLWIKARWHGVFPCALDPPSPRRCMRVRLASGRERRRMRHYLRDHLVQSAPLVAPKPDNSVLKDDWLAMLRSQLPFNAHWLTRIAAGTLGAVPSGCLVEMQSIDHVVLYHVPTAQYFGHLLSLITGCPKLLKNKQGLRLARGIDHILVQTRCHRPETPMRNVRLPRAIAQATLLVMVAASLQRPLHLPSGPLQSVALQLRQHAPWLTSCPLLGQDGYPGIKTRSIGSGSQPLLQPCPSHAAAEPPQSSRTPTGTTASCTAVSLC